MIDWGEGEGMLPCHLLGFVNLLAMPDNSGVMHGGSGAIYPGIFASVEVAQKVTEEELEIRSELFVPYAKEVGGFTGKFVSHNKYYLADVEAIVGPAAVIPDVGSGVNRYLYIKDRHIWKKDFQKWLEVPSHLDEVFSSEGEEDADDRENFEEQSLNDEEDALTASDRD
jgi:hypothetical protein